NASEKNVLDVGEPGPIRRLREPENAGSNPAIQTDRGPRSVPVARDRAKVEGEVRLLTGMLRGRRCSTARAALALEDAGAGRPGGRLQPDRSRFNSCRRF